MDDTLEQLTKEYDALKSHLGGLIVEQEATASDEQVIYYTRKFTEAKNALKRHKALAKSSAKNENTGSKIDSAIERTRKRSVEMLEEMIHEGIVAKGDSIEKVIQVLRGKNGS